MGVSGRRHDLTTLYPEVKDTWYRLDTRLSLPRSGLDEEARRKILCPCQELNPSHPLHTHTILTELPRPRSNYFHIYYVLAHLPASFRHVSTRTAATDAGRQHLNCHRMLLLLPRVLLYKCILKIT
jgi:hypothetical protein